MINIKIEKKRVDNPICKIWYNELTAVEERFLKRVFMDSKKEKDSNTYIVPIRYVSPIINNLCKESINIHPESILSFMEFSDSFDEKYYYTFETTPKYMKKWREEGCPEIFKITIEPNTKELIKEVAFKRINSRNSLAINL